MKIFYSYCHKDEHFRDEVAKFLSPIRDSVPLEEWHDRRIGAGQRIHKEIDRHIEESDIVLLFLSPDYLNSTECKSEMHTAMRFRQENGTAVIPVIVRPCGWTQYEISDLRAVPIDGRPITNWPQRDMAYLDIYENVKDVVDTMPSHPTSEYVKFLTGVEFISQNKVDIRLDDIFVLPSIESSHDQRAIECLDEIWTKNNHVIVHGDDRSGKTVLCRKLVVDESRHGRPVMLLSGDEITSSLNHEQVIQRRFRENFRGSYAYWRGRRNKMLIIDDVNRDLRMSFVTYAKEHFERILLVMATDDYIAFFKGEQSVADFDLLTLTTLGHPRQEKLIRKWLSLNSDHPDTVRVSHGKIDQIEDKLNTVIIHNKIVPRYPFYVLSILQTLEAFMPQGLQITAYGHCYQVLITAQIMRMGVDSGDVDAALNFLRHFSYRVYLDDKCCSHERFAEFLDEYRREFEIKESIWRRLSGEESLILRQSPAGYEFSYPFVYYFFVGHYFAQYSREHKDLIEQMADRSYVRDNAYILTFVIHHAQDHDLIDTILLHTACSLDDVPIATLNASEVRFVERALTEVPNMIVSERSVSEERTRQRRLWDHDEANSRELGADRPSSSDSRNEFYRLLKNMEILGQVLRNRHGSLRRDKLAEIVGFVTEAGLRAVSMLQRELVYLARLCSDMLNNNDTPKHLRDDVESLRDLLPKLAFLVVQLLLRRIVISIQKPEVVRIVGEVFQQSPTPAYGLLQAFFTLKTREELDRNVVARLERLHTDLTKTNNVVAMRVLSLEMQSYLNTHSVHYQERQKMFEILGFKYRPNRE